MAEGVVILIGIVILFVILRLVFNTQPNQIDQRQVQAIHDMFPNVSLNHIQQDLNRTGSVQITTENILNGRLPITTSSRNLPTTPKPTFENPKYISESPLKEPKKEWVSDAQERQNQLLQRKQFMMQQARQKYKQKFDVDSDKS
ncbi:hypothetical protein BC833DRAFT_613125, partial [Globomyces pollinis-pini]